MGTYKELIDKKGSFSDFIMAHIQEEIEDNDEGIIVLIFSLFISATNTYL